MDDNGYPDLVVGAFDSSKTIVLRSRPVINVQVRVQGIFLYLVYFFIECYCKLNLLYLLATLPRCTFTTMSIVYLFVSVLLFCRKIGQ